MKKPPSAEQVALALAWHVVVRDTHFPMDGRCGFCWRVGVRPAVWPCGARQVAEEQIRALGGDPDAADGKRPPPRPRKAGQDGG